MKSIIGKITILLSVVFFIGFYSSCVEVEYLDCDNAEVVIVNNSDAYVWFSLDSVDPYCYAEDYIKPGESLIVDYGPVHSRSDMPEYLEFYYIFEDYGVPVYAVDIEIESCDNVLYIE
jgi:hypothetical protein